MTSFDIQVAAMTPAQAVENWEACKGFLMMACEHDIEGKVSVGSLYDNVQSGESLCIGVWRDGVLVACAVVGATNLKNGRHLFVQACGGVEMVVWIDQLVDFVECTAQAAGCVDGILFVGRPGWRNVLANLGFNTVLVTMRREVKRI